MEPSSTFCRAQEAIQRDRADKASLENEQAIARRAANAWGTEAAFAERREARREKIRAMAETARSQSEQEISEEERLLSDNPDRGFANS